MRKIYPTYPQSFFRPFLACIVLLMAFRCGAYDFYSITGAGSHIYFNILSDKQVQITYEERLSPTSSYLGNLMLPDKVRYEGTEYTVTSIGDYAFFGCRDLQQVILPSSITSIGRCAFGWCDALGEIELPTALAHIEPDAFDGCFSLTSLSVAPGNADLKCHDNAIFSADGSRLIAVAPTAVGAFTVPDGVTSISRRALGGCTFIDDIPLPESLVSIESDALTFCSSLTTLRIPASVQSIGTGAFADCYSLASIEVDADNIHFSSHEGILYNADSSVLIQSPGACISPAFLPTTTQIAPMAFMHNYSLTTVLLPQAVTKVGEAAFVGCENMASALLLEEVSEIGAMAFGLCSSLHSLYVMNSQPEKISLGEGAFAGIDTEKCVLYVPRGAKSAFLHLQQWCDFRSIVETDPLLEQFISWPGSTDEYIDESHIILNASASSLLPVEYVLSPYSTGIAVLQGNALESIVPGPVDVIVYQRGNNTYLPAAPVVRTFFDPNSGVEDVDADANVRVYGLNRMIVIKGAPADAIAQVFDINGRSVYTGTAREIPIAVGAIYAVRVADRTFKVLVR